MKQIGTRVLGRVLQLIGLICWIHCPQENLYSSWSAWALLIVTTLLIIEGIYMEFSN